MARNVEPARVPAELLCAAMDPGERAAHLLGHHRQVATEVLHRREIQDDEGRAGVHEQLRGKSVILREPAAPRPAVDEHVDRCVRARAENFTAAYCVVACLRIHPKPPQHQTRKDTNVSGANSSSAFSRRFESPCSWW